MAAHGFRYSRFTRVMTVLVYGLVAAIVGLVIAACSPFPKSASAQYTTADSFEEIHKPLSDGRTVTCIAAATGYGFAASCDWAGAK